MGSWDVLTGYSSTTDRQPQGRDEGLCHHRPRRKGGRRALAPYCQQLWCRHVRGLSFSRGMKRNGIIWVASRLGELKIHKIILSTPHLSLLAKGKEKRKFMDGMGPQRTLGLGGLAGFCILAAACLGVKYHMHDKQINTKPVLLELMQPNPTRPIPGRDSYDMASFAKHPRWTQDTCLFCRYPNKYNIPS